MLLAYRFSDICASHPESNRSPLSKKSNVLNVFQNRARFRTGWRSRLRPISYASRNGRRFPYSADVFGDKLARAIQLRKHGL